MPVIPVLVLIPVHTISCSNCKNASFICPRHKTTIRDTLWQYLSWDGFSFDKCLVFAATGRRARAGLDRVSAEAEWPDAGQTWSWGETEGTSVCLTSGVGDNLFKWQVSKDILDKEGGCSRVIEGGWSNSSRWHGASGQCDHWQWSPASHLQSPHTSFLDHNKHTTSNQCTAPWRMASSRKR